MYRFLTHLVSSIKTLIVGKQEVQKKEIEADQTLNSEKTEIQKAEIQSDDVYVRQYRYRIFYLVIICILLEAFGVRLWVMNKLGIDPNVVDFDSILKLFSDILSSALVNS